MTVEHEHSRYVIQRHIGHDDDHYDLMLQRGQVLWTWRVDRLVQPDSQPIQAIRIADHRLAYLTYEGTISGGRGSCRIAAAGKMRWQRCLPDLIEVELLDGQAAGNYRLTRQQDRPDCWNICPLGFCPMSR